MAWGENQQEHTISTGELDAPLTNPPALDG
jgi:hypothetical protein